jgi:hypothetical protein
MRKKKFVVKGLVESREIQESYDRGEYFEAVLKCRVYLESWLGEYIYAILYPSDEGANKENRRSVQERFDDMFIQLHWLKDRGYISKNDYINLNKIRAFCNKVFQTGNVARVANLAQLDRLIESSIHYCGKFQKLTARLINQAEAKKISMRS